MIGVSTCVRSLAWPGECCVADCDDKATTAVLIENTESGLQECARCPRHVHSGAFPLAVKPLRLGIRWEPGTTAS